MARTRQIAGTSHKEGAAREDERPKSREETPKVGYDTPAKPNVPRPAIWACLWCSATATIGPRVHFGTHVAHLHRSCAKPRPTDHILRLAPSAGTTPIIPSWRVALSARANAQ